MNKGTVASNMCAGIAWQKGLTVSLTFAQIVIRSSIFKAQSSMGSITLFAKRKQKRQAAGCPELVNIARICLINVTITTCDAQVFFLELIHVVLSKDVAETFSS
jgi:hypothetical protein